MTNRKENSIDLFKLIFSICVVAIHIVPLANFQLPTVIRSIYETVLALAVPFFFLACGYLLGKKLRGQGRLEVKKQISSRINGLVRLYLIWSIIYLPITVIYWIQEDLSPIHVLISAVRGYLILGQQYNSWMLWYLLAAIYGLALLWVMYHFRFNAQWIGGGVLLLFLLGAWIDDPSLWGSTGLIWEVAIKARNIIGEGRIFSGGIYLYLGILLASQKWRPSLVWCGVIFVAGFVGKMLLPGMSGSICLLLASTALFPLILSIQLKDRHCYGVMRRMSTVIYFMHLMVWTVFYTLAYGAKTEGLLPFSVTLGICVIFALGVVAYEKKKKFLLFF